MNSRFSVRPFREGDEAAFARLNLDWIEAHFGIEEEDRRQLLNARAAILDKGGAILIAELDGKAVGTGAMIPASHAPAGKEAWGEVVKMATAPEAQGIGIGSAILDRLIETARERQMQGLWLETNDKLAAATRLYARKGFTALNPDEIWETPYARCNLQMTLELTA